MNNSLYDTNNKITNRTFINFNNNYPSFYDNINNNINIINQQENKNELKIIESKGIVFKNQNIKKPSTRKTLDSDHLLKDFSQSNDMNSIPDYIQNSYNDRINNIQNNNQNKEPLSKVLKIRLSNSGRNSFLGDNNSNNNMNL